jgi:hypothetical protein
MRTWREAGAYVGSHALSNGENLSVDDLPLGLLRDDDAGLGPGLSDSLLNQDAVEEGNESLQRLGLKV